MPDGSIEDVVDDDDDEVEKEYLFKITFPVRVCVVLSLFWCGVILLWSDCLIFPSG